ncbi:MAG TPA: choice-of-anchor D domain-containing protein [Myxococcota bacterium]|nr:choice-of-anchor D domain-containing protein [Myxococcota bacterium]HRY93161.1 choice-of-anchor D domain-containing protein [Myxococcota bacterium]
MRRTCMFLGVLVFAAGLAGCDDETVKATHPRLGLEVDDGQGAFTTGCEAGGCSLDFGLVYLGNTAERLVVVRNSGDGVLHLGAVAVSPEGAPFQVALDASVAAPGQSLTLRVSYTPPLEGAHAASLLLPSDDPDHPALELPLAGRSEPVPTPQLQVCVPADPADPESALDCAPPHGVDWGQVALVPLGEPRSARLVLRNVGKETLLVHAVAAAPGTSQEFSVEPASGELQLAAYVEGQPPDEAELALWYAPQDGGQDEGVFTIASNDPEERVVEVAVRGVGIAPRVCLEPLSLDFGRVAVGHTAARTFEISNCGLMPLTVAQIYLHETTSPDFAFAALPLTPFELAPAESQVIEVQFTPSLEGPVGGRVYTLSNDPSAELGYLGLGGQGTDDPICDIQVSPRRHNFGVVDPGTSASKTTTLANVGSAECRVESIAPPSGPGQSAYELTQLPITPLVLGPGDARDFSVRYTPADGGPHRADVRITTTDFEQTEELVELYGNDPAVPECNVEVVPDQIAFGTVALWRTALLELHVNNPGAEGCVLSGLELTPQTDTAFTLAELPSLPASIPAGGQAIALVAFTPIQRRSHAGELRLVTSDPDTPVRTLPLNGAGEELNLMVLPDRLDFGRVTLGCQSPDLNVRVYNVGSGAVTIEDVYLDAVRTDPEFSMVSLEHGGVAAMPPFSLGPADVFNIRLRYAPQQEELNRGVLVIQSTAALGTTMEVPMQGEGTTVADQTDLFQQLDHPMVDILWVIDNSGSMSDDQQALAQNFATFINWAINLSTDFQIGVISTEINEPDVPADFFNIYPGILVFYPGFPRILTNTTPNLVQAFARNVNVGTCCSDEQESGLHAAMLALSEPLISSLAANGGFMRPDAKLVMIMVSDEPDQSPSPVDFYVDFFKALKGVRNDQLMDVSCIVSAGEDGARYRFVQESTGGLFRDLEGGDWGATLSDLGLDAFAARTQFPLSRPANPLSLVVSVDNQDGQGLVVVPEDPDESGDGWVYDPISNSVIFGDDVVPGRGAVIQVEYETVCL